MAAAGAKGVLVVGCGASGLAAARLHQRRADPRPLWVFDDQAEVLDAAVAVGHRRWSGELNSVAEAVWSPGVPLGSALADDLRAGGAAIVSEVSFAAPDFGAAVAVTGTNGKSTVTTLITALLCAGGTDAVAAGNVGKPLSDLALRQASGCVPVVELSSYQLELPLALTLKAAVLTNLSPDHLDRYPTLETYYQVKRGLITALPAGAGAVFSPQLVETAAVSAMPLPDATEIVGGWNRSAALSGNGGLNNLAQAVAVARFFDVDDRISQRIAQTFEGLPHRGEVVAERRGLRFVDDSKATNVAAAIASLDRVDGALVVLLGGADKGEDYDLLAAAIARRGASAVCFGAQGERLATATGGERVADLAAAVEVARRRLASGGTILLAPSCASFDAYASFAARGRHFAELAREEAPCVR
jgi:UDP-N-acetylmuramoylalanine--D-glutamate ligase